MIIEQIRTQLSLLLREKVAASNENNIALSNAGEQTDE